MITADLVCYTRGLAITKSIHTNMIHLRTSFCNDDFILFVFTLFVFPLQAVVNNPAQNQTIPIQMNSTPPLPDGEYKIVLK